MKKLTGGKRRSESKCIFDDRLPHGYGIGIFNCWIEAESFMAIEESHIDKLLLNLFLKSCFDNRKSKVAMQADKLLPCLPCAVGYLETKNLIAVGGEYAEKVDRQA